MKKTIDTCLKQNQDGLRRPSGLHSKGPIGELWWLFLSDATYHAAARHGFLRSKKQQGLMVTNQPVV